MNDLFALSAWLQEGKRVVSGVMFCSQNTYMTALIALLINYGSFGEKKQQLGRCTLSELTIGSKIDHYSPLQCHITLDTITKMSYL